MADNDASKKDVHEARVKAAKARAKSLPAKRRREIGQKAALSRWDPKMPFAEHESGDHPLRIGNIELACYVLNDGMRAFSQRGLMDALGLGVRGGQIEALLDVLSDYLAPEIAESLRNPLLFRRKGGGPLVHGSPATLLVDICNAILERSKAGGVFWRMNALAARAQMIVSAVAKTGIIALVDEATGYSRKETLQALLDRYLRHELAVWSKRFPDEFYEHIFRLRGWNWRGRSINPPGVVAHYTKDFVYARLAPGILPELERRNPKVGKYRRGKHTQLLTEDLGVPALEQHLRMVLTIMRGSNSWHELEMLMDKLLPRKPENLQLPLLEWGKEQAVDEDGPKMLEPGKY